MTAMLVSDREVAVKVRQNDQCGSVGLLDRSHSAEMLSTKTGALCMHFERKKINRNPGKRVNVGPHAREKIFHQFEEISLQSFWYFIPQMPKNDVIFPETMWGPNPRRKYTGAQRCEGAFRNMANHLESAWVQRPPTFLTSINRQRRGHSWKSRTRRRRIPAEPPSALAGHRRIGDGVGGSKRRCHDVTENSTIPKAVVSGLLKEILRNIVAGGSQASHNRHVKIPFKTF
ncbi:hypothetical protein B0H13DRAFT_1902488 [Mycena leptocephala]|nr:hypothetical protein B0H13DRAFT_1902488 [Mycena leptocephala]